MALTEIVFGSPKKAKIGVVQLDASVSESHGKTNEVTSYPIEDGATISDHIIRKPDEIEINGVVTNHPVVFLASLNSPSPLEGDLTSPGERAELAYAELSRIMNEGELVSVVTTLKEYENMAIRSLVVTRDARRGNMMDAKIGLIEVPKAETETTEALKNPSPKNAANKKPVGKGPKPTKAAEPRVKDAASGNSILAELFQ